jgi:type IV pilus assembly protein PilA
MLKAILTRLRETSTRESEGDQAREAGFTLIELMVVLLIIAILLAIAIPTFLGVANSAGDRAAQSNLTNALTEVKALYQNSASYNASANTPMTPANEFQASAPEFAWANNTTCTGGSAGNCVSVQVVDATATNDAQGIELAVYSAKTQTCWYAVDLESAPVAFADTGAPTGPYSFSSASNVPTGATTAGVFYGKKTGSANCIAGYPSQTAAAFAWGQNYSSAPGTN